MHIPDGYLSPQTCAVIGAAMVPVLYKSVKEVNKELDKKDIPAMAIGSPQLLRWPSGISFCF